MSQPTAAIFARHLRLLGLAAGFQAAGTVSWPRLPAALMAGPEIAALGRGTYLVVALSCRDGEREDGSAPGDPHALIAPFASSNYYAEAVHRLKGVASSLGESHGFSRRDLRLFSNSRLPEKPLAVASGIGVYGKNSLVLIPGLGSLAVIAGLFLPVVAEEERPAAGGPGPGGSAAPGRGGFPLCGSCRACLQACPVAALRRPGRLDTRRCLQALCTLISPFSEEVRRAWGIRFYGCQSCQDVCPHNRDLTGSIRVERGRLGASLPLRRLLSLPPAALKAELRGSALAMSWIPARALLRNALVAAGNHGDAAAAPEIARHRSGRDAFLREAADWAARRIACGGGAA